MLCIICIALDKWGIRQIFYVFLHQNICATMRSLIWVPVFLGHFLPPSDSRRVVASFWWKNLHKYWAGLRGSVGWASDWWSGGCGFEPYQVGSILSWRLWNIFCSHSLTSADSRRTVVSFWWKNVHKYWASLCGSVGWASNWWSGGCGFDPAPRLGTFFHGELIIKYFQRSSHLLIQEGQLSVLGERIFTILVNPLEE